MSDNWIVLIPEDPRFVPDPAKRDRGSDRFAEIAPDADEIEVKVSETVEFFDCAQFCFRALHADWDSHCLVASSDGRRLRRWRWVQAGHLGNTVPWSTSPLPPTLCTNGSRKDQRFALTQ